MNEQQARVLGLKLVEQAEAAYLTTIDDNGFPQTRAMLNLRRKVQYPGLVDFFEKRRNDFLIYFTTNTSSSKIKQIKENPRVSVYYCKPDEWRGLMLGGEIEIITDREIKKALWQEGWEVYYPRGINDPDYAVLCLEPQVARYYHQLNSVQFGFAAD